jgi:hypothetical protein
VQVEQDYFFFAVFFAAFSGAGFFAVIKYQPSFRPRIYLVGKSAKGGQVRNIISYSLPIRAILFPDKSFLRFASPFLFFSLYASSSMIVQLATETAS